ncbi:MAG: hypothetical protein LBL87_05760 [Ruminococcus sp.]|nr:hypothetical protein [Ruminococcus sp.]
MKTKKIHIKSADISDDRIKELEAAPLEKRAMSEAERAVIGKNTIVFFLTGIGLIVAAIALTLLGSSASKLVIIIFLVLLIGGIKIAVGSLADFCNSFRDIRNKTPEQAISNFFYVVLIGNDTSEFDKKLVSYSYGALQRMIPELISVDYKEFENYLVNFRRTIQQTADGKYKDIFKTTSPPVGYQYGISYEFANEEKTASETHMSKSKIVLTFYEQKTDPKSNKSKSVRYAVFDITLELLLIKSGKFWFVADPMPAYDFIGKQPTVKTEEGTKKEKDEVTQ